ncbi:hypothetical protein [Mesorhizobium sp. L-2-11]|uniref:hypothetical protein n=1 Tax=Mesorhizobium sp. L-2-11 TaxID=2744521 RepID=UPI001926FB22|nr:hypothetical protein [Mesorhizobium sp. L-2-11]
MRNSGVVWLTLMAGVVAPSSEAVACGYDSPQSVSRGVLNWAYPDSLHVIGAISREVAARRLPLANFNRAGPDLFGKRFRATKTALEKFGELLRAASSDPSQLAFSLVLAEPVLWTRFEPSADGLHAKVHVASAEPGDLVLVTGEAVISEIALGRLAVGEASERGLIRFYGSEKQKSDFIGTYRHAGGQPIAKWARAMRRCRLPPSLSLTQFNLQEGIHDQDIAVRDGTGKPDGLCASGDCAGRRGPG